MRTYKARAGPFAERPFFDDAELEAIANDELRKAGLLPPTPGAVRIDRFIEKRFNVVPEYDDLPPGILGFSQFGTKGVEAVVLARALAEQGRRSSERVLNSTLAHEAGHMLLHGHLFYLERRTSSLRLLDDDLDDVNKRILCRMEAQTPTNDSRPRYDGRWWEYQANQMIGPLLMPRGLVSIVVEPLCSPAGRLGATSLSQGRRDDAVRLLTEVFDVNAAAARVRLDRLYTSVSAAQLPL